MARVRFGSKAVTQQFITRLAAFGQKQSYPRTSSSMFTLFDPEKQQKEDRGNRQMDNLRIDGLEVDE